MLLLFVLLRFNNLVLCQSRVSFEEVNDSFALSSELSLALRVDKTENSAQTYPCLAARLTCLFEESVDEVDCTLDLNEGVASA